MKTVWNEIWGLRNMYRIACNIYPNCSCKIHSSRNSPPKKEGLKNLPNNLEIDISGTHRSQPQHIPCTHPHHAAQH